MSVSIILAVYAAALSSLLAFIQILEWRRKQRFLVIRCRQGWWQNDAVFWNVTISNRADKPVQMIFVALAMFEPKRMLRRRALAISEMSIKEYDDREPDIIGEPLDGRILQPGETIHAIVRQEEIEEINNDFGFVVEPSGRRCYGVSIEHSQQDYPVIAMLSVPENLVKCVTSAEILNHKRKLMRETSTSQLK